MSTIAFTLSNNPIRQDAEGRFCLNDLHKAAGGENKDRPSIWLANQQAIDLVNELSPRTGLDEQTPNSVYDLSRNSRLAPITSVKGGANPGTYAVKELVYAYAPNELLRTQQAQ